MLRQFVSSHKRLVTSSSKFRLLSTTSSSQLPAAPSSLKYGSVAIPIPHQYNISHYDWLAKIPKGWGKFYPKGEESASEAESTSTGAKTDDKSSSAETKSTNESSKQKMSDGQKSGGSGDGGGGGKKKSTDPMDRPEVRYAALASAVLISLLMISDFSSPGKEITWQEFQSQLLESGEVDRLIVTNKNIAKVVLRSPVKLPAGGDAFNDHHPPGYVPPRVTASATPTDSSGSTPAPVQFGYNVDDNKDGARGKSRYPTLGLAPGSHMPYYFAIGSVETFERKLEEAQRQLGISARDFIPVMYVSETDWVKEAIRFIPTLLIVGTSLYLMRGLMSGMGGGGGGGGPGGIFKIGKSPAKMITKENVTTRFADVAGCDEAKKEVMEFVEFLKEPKKFTDLGAKIPRGALLCGPPGTGKTLLAKATAGEASVPFYSISGSDFLEMFVGVGPARVRDLFKEARANAPCIIFIDEIDAVGRQRGRGGFGGGNDERENTLNQLLVEMDGFDSTANVVVLAGTNRADILDSALTRPGRFDRQITVDKPDISGRKAIFKVHLKGITLDGESDDYSSRLAALTPGFSGADIANICNEAAITAARRSKKKVDLEDFESATDRVIGGLESKKIMTLEEKTIVAYHEAGHAVAGWNLEHADPLLKVTIVPRSSGALGFAQYLPKEIYLRNKVQILDMVTMALAGRAAEQVIFGRFTTGASDDLRRVTQIVYQMVQVYGMNERVGQLSFPKEEGGYGQENRLYSNVTAEVMDEEVRGIVDKAYQRTLALMEEKKEQLHLVAKCLMEQETITNADVTRLIGPRPFAANKEYAEFLAAGAGKKTPLTAEEAAAAANKKTTEGNTEDTSSNPVLSPV